MKYLSAFVVLFVALSAHAADDIEKLIEGEQKTRSEWTASAEELPEAYLWGDQNAVELVSPQFSEERQNIICQQVPYDELIELSKGKPLDRETVINMDLPRIREIIENACLVRPNDSMVAVGAGSQKKVTLKNFVVRRDQKTCPNGSPYSLWASLETQLDTNPLFFTTILTWPETFNGYLKRGEENAIDLEGPLRKKLTSQVVDQSEYKLTIMQLHAPNAERLLILRRSTARLEDDQLPNEILLADTSEGIKTIWMERVDLKKGSGHLIVDATFDYNLDGLLGLVVTGVHQNCPYTAVFEGSKAGFKILDLPIKNCRCD